MLWPCLGRSTGVESHLLHSGSLGSPKGVVGHSVLDHTHRIGFLSTTHPPNSLHPCYYSFFLLVSAYHCLFFFCSPQTILFPHPPTHYRAVKTFEYAWKVFLEIRSRVGGGMRSRKQQKQQHQRWPHDPGTEHCKRMGYRSEDFPTQVASIPSHFCMPHPFLSGTGKPAFSLPRCPVSALSLVNGFQVPKNCQVRTVVALELRISSSQLASPGHAPIQSHAPRTWADPPTLTTPFSPSPAHLLPELWWAMAPCSCPFSVSFAYMESIFLLSVISYVFVKWPEGGFR